MTKRTVAFIDILGFKGIVDASSADELGEKFTNVIGKTLPALNGKIGDFPNEPTFFPNYPRDRPYCISFAFSDSIILISNDESEESCLALLIYSLRVSQILIGYGFPVRGAITFGEMYVDRENSLFLGKALTRAYTVEQRQNWIGLVKESQKSALISKDRSSPKISLISGSSANVLSPFSFSIPF